MKRGFFKRKRKVLIYEETTIKHIKNEKIERSTNFQGRCSPEGGHTKCVLLLPQLANIYQDSIRGYGRSNGSKNGGRMGVENPLVEETF